MDRRPSGLSETERNLLSSRARFAISWRCALLDKPARSAYNKNAKEIAFMEFMKANKKPFGIASTEGLRSSYFTM